MFSPTPSSAAVFEREMLPHVTLGIWFSVFGHLVPNFGIGISVIFPRDLCYIWTGSVFVLFSSWLASEIHRGGRMDGWRPDTVTRVMDFLSTFAVAIVGVFPERWVPAWQNTFSLRDGFSRCSSDGACSLSPSDQFLSHKVRRAGHTPLAGTPRILAAELCRVSPKRRIPTAKKSCGYSHVLTFFQTRNDSADV
jgi:hypothetical protein